MARMAATRGALCFFTGESSSEEDGDSAAPRRRSAFQSSSAPLPHFQPGSRFGPTMKRHWRVRETLNGWLEKSSEPVDVSSGFNWIALRAITKVSVYNGIQKKALHPTWSGGLSDPIMIRGRGGQGGDWAPPDRRRFCGGRRLRAVPFAAPPRGFGASGDRGAADARGDA